MANNRDFEDFRAQTSDNFKQTVSIELAYHLQGNWWITGGYEHLLGPNLGQYLITDPRYQFGIGVIYSKAWKQD